jgi:hypothetical protein
MPLLSSGADAAPRREWCRLDLNQAIEIAPDAVLGRDIALQQAVKSAFAPDLI